MRRNLGLVVAALGFATAASAGTLTVFTTDLSNVSKNTFLVGETFFLKVTGDGQGQTQEDSILGQLIYNGSITDTLGATQGQWLPNVGELFPSEGNTYVFNQAGSPVVNQVQTSVITLFAVAPGTSSIIWGGTLLDFFGLYAYGSSVDIPTGHSFTIVPEPATAALVGVGLCWLATRRRTRARSRRRTRSAPR